MNDIPRRDWLKYGVHPITGFRSTGNYKILAKYERKRSEKKQEP